MLDLRPASPESSRTGELQLAYYDDETNPEWEIERPAGAPPLYRWLLEEKFRRSVSRIERLLDGSTVLTVCGGSGLDAEFLAAAGARVVSSDASYEAVRRALVRSERHGVPFDALAADARKLPFCDRSFDIVYVHDGLHHLDDPFEGLREMARVARVAVSLTEPAIAVATRIATKLGIAGDVEAAGNRVARLRPADVERELELAGFRVVCSARYGMFYRHEPGFAMLLFSRPGLFATARMAIAAGNVLAGSIGNKLTVQAVRRRAT